MRAINKVMHKKTPLIKVSSKAFEIMGYLMEMTAEFITRKAPIMTSQAAKASALGLSADISRAEKELGYTCRPLEESIRDAFDWFKTNDYL